MTAEGSPIAADFSYDSLTAPFGTWAVEDMREVLKAEGFL
jgi:hypothetical protein